MKKERLSVEEVNQFKPSFENPMCVESDTCVGCEKRIKIVSSFSRAGDLVIVDNDGDFRVWNFNLISCRGYNSLKPQRMLRELWRWEMIDKYNGDFVSKFMDNNMFDLNNSQMLASSYKWKRKIDSSRILWDDQNKCVVDDEN